MDAEIKAKEDAEFERTLQNLWTAWLKEYDTDGSGTISLEELKKFAELPAYTGSDSYMQTLHDWAKGANEDGSLEEAFKGVDTDGSGELEFEEFKKMLADDNEEGEEV
ncbi:EF-hand domain-containing protein [Pseudoscourfieldia marina]